MEKIIYLCPENERQYQYYLQVVGPRLDDAGLSFHICRPGEDITGVILKREVKL